MTELISIENVIKREQQGKKIINNLSAKVLLGELITIIGPSGAGKSTLLSLLNRMIDPDEGLIKYKGENYLNIDVLGLRRQIGIVFQLPTMIKGTVEENIQIGPKHQDNILTEEEVDNLLTTVGLSSSIKTQDANTLSGGQKQKVSLARTLANNPEVLLLDEVTASLDPDSTKEIEELIDSLHQDGKTILWVTHNIEQAKKMGQYTWVLADGKMIEYGKTIEIFSNPNKDITKRYINKT